MPRPRHTLISLDATPYYHCVSRCVRRAFLCGEDSQTGRSFEHRRGWIEERLLSLAEVFAMDVCAYAVMSNHTHVVLHVDRVAAQEWSVDEVIDRWHREFSGVSLSQRYLRGERLGRAEWEQLQETAETWRLRLMSVSWFMRGLNEHIARLANAEDECTGRFWEGRFKSQAILDEAALAACLAYVDLNPVRACMADTPERSDFTSVKRRVEALRTDASTNSGKQPALQPKQLLPFVGNPRAEMPKGLPFPLIDYLELLDWTGRQIREDKHGAIAADAPPILHRLNIEPMAWMQLATRFEANFCSLVGRIPSVEHACGVLGQRWARGAGACRRLFSP